MPSIYIRLLRLELDQLGEQGILAALDLAQLPRSTLRDAQRLQWQMELCGLVHVRGDLRCWWLRGRGAGGSRGRGEGSHAESTMSVVESPGEDGGAIAVV